MEQCGQGKSATRIRNFGTRIGSKGRARRAGGREAGAGPPAGGPAARARVPNRARAAPGTPRGPRRRTGPASPAAGRGRATDGGRRATGLELAVTPGI